MSGRKWLAKISDGYRRRIVGRRGEKLAARHLRRVGYRILERNLTVGRDEADLIALAPDGRTVVVVEVKTRTGDFLSPELNINRNKQYRLARLAAKLLQTRRFEGRPFRFDAVAIYWPESGKPELRHYEAAFDSPI